MWEQITNSIDNHDYCAGVFIDLSKAFDTIDHTILLTKLPHYGMCGVTLDCFKNYLTNRLQFVSIENVYSSNGCKRCGVRQGSILFLIYINDICYSSSVLKFILFADNTNLFHSSKSISERQHMLNHYLNGLMQIDYHQIQIKHHIFYSVPVMIDLSLSTHLSSL